MGLWRVALLLLLPLLLLLLAPGLLVLGGRAPRYALNPLGKRWERDNLTYRIDRFPSSLGHEETRTAIARAFSMWSHVSPLSFHEVPPTSPADFRIGFYRRVHEGCARAPALLHPCFDGRDGELAHAFLPPRGDVHLDDDESWVLGTTRFSWTRGVWMNDLVQVAAHEIGHALGLMHSRRAHALMHANATATRTRSLARDDVWGIQRLYGCRDKSGTCDRWVRRGLCSSRPRLSMSRCASSCDLCYGHAPPSATPRPRTPPKAKVVTRGRIVTFHCGRRSSLPGVTVSWYKDGEWLEASVPGRLTMSGRELRLVANEVNEGEYTCTLARGASEMRANAWRIVLKDPHGEEGGGGETPTAQVPRPGPSGGRTP
ncbi:unnamed protein product [Lampetra fluviatilis]